MERAPRHNLLVIMGAWTSKWAKATDLGTRRQNKIEQAMNNRKEECRERAKGDEMAVMWSHKSICEIPGFLNALGTDQERECER